MDHGPSALPEILADLCGDHVFAAEKLRYGSGRGAGTYNPRGSISVRSAICYMLRRASATRKHHIPTALSLTRSPISLHHCLSLSLSLSSGHDAPASVEDSSFFMYARRRFESNFGLLGDGADDRDALEPAAGERKLVRDMIQTAVLEQLGYKVAFVRVWSETDDMNSARRP